MPSAQRFDRYHVLRRENGILRYGLSRRTGAALHLLAMAGARPPRAVLDIGAADGAMARELARRFPERRFVGLEPDRGLRRLAATQTPTVAGDARRLPFASGSFDVVLLSATLKHIPDPARVLEECLRVLVPGGHLLLLDPSPWGIRIGLFLGHFDRRYVPNIWSLSMTTRRLGAAGFEILRAYRYMIAPLRLPGGDGLESLLAHRPLDLGFLQQAILARRPER
jgi:ubiquinone/menaquinone biosynthesis C-methylase UbiE